MCLLIKMGGWGIGIMNGLKQEKEIYPYYKANRPVLGPTQTPIQ
jgi:hypothetical protein